MVFAGSILTTTVLEWNLFDGNDSNDEKPLSPDASRQGTTAFFLNNLFKIETLLVLPALTGSIVSGVAQAFLSYGSLRYAPRHVKASLHLLLAFGLWWGFTDRRTQGDLERAVASGDFRAKVWRRRRISNVVSCLFLVGMYSIMILKPGS